MPHSAGRIRKNRFPISLNHRIDQKLLSYSAAASAAGVALLALALPSEAEIVYTLANQKIRPGGSFALDLNHDGITDFNFQNNFGSCALGTYDCLYQILVVHGPAPNGVLTFQRYRVRALSNFSRVGPGESVGDGLLDRCKATRTSAYTTNSFASKFRYIGLAFSINGQVHYGWARFQISVQPKCDVHVLMIDYAYQTLPGEPILAGERVNHKVSATESSRDTLGGLALGAVGLDAWRRDEAASKVKTSGDFAP
jgi:hypothetical protein